MPYFKIKILNLNKPLHLHLLTHRVFHDPINTKIKINTTTISNHIEISKTIGIFQIKIKIRLFKDPTKMFSLQESTHRLNQLLLIETKLLLLFYNAIKTLN